MHRVTLAREAMATRFEFVLLGEDPVKVRAAGEEALEEIHRIEAQLSLYRSSSEIARVNALAAHEPVRVSPATFSLLEKCRSISEISGGAFDITIAPLVRCWGFMKGSGARALDEEIAAARSIVGMHLLELNPGQSTVRFRRHGMMLDLGSIGKGYALDQAVEILKDAGIENALLHGGTSSIYALGRDIAGPWKVALETPRKPGESRESAPMDCLAVIELENQSMSVSAVWGKFFMLEGRRYGHVIDPRTGWPAENALLGCVVVESATDSDALSTFALLADPSELPNLKKSSEDVRYLQARLSGDSVHVEASGIEVLGRNRP